MAKLRFLKDGEPSQKKNYVPESKYLKRKLLIWRILGIIELAMLVYFIK